MDLFGVPKIAARPRIGCEAASTTSQTISHGTLTAVNLPAETFDTHAFHSLTVNNNRITIPPGLDGLYLVWAAITYNGNSSGIRALVVAKNAVFAPLVLVQQIGNGGASTIAMSTAKGLVLKGSDYLELYAYQDSGSSIDLRGPDTTNDTSFLGVVRVSD